VRNIVANVERKALFVAIAIIAGFIAVAAAYLMLTS